MPVYEVIDRSQRVPWDISRPAVPAGGGRAVVTLQGTLNNVGVGETLNFEVNSRFTGLVTRTPRLTFCCAVSVLLFVDGVMHRVSMQHVLGGDPSSVDWAPLVADMTPPIGSTASTKKIVVAWNSGPVTQEMTRLAVARTSVPHQNIYHYLGNNGFQGITFAVMWPFFVGEVSVS